MSNFYYAVFVLIFISSVVTQSPWDVNQFKNSTINHKNDSLVKLLPFMPLAHGLRSGPITILDPRTIFIEDLHYDGKGPAAYFWVGKGQWPSDNGTILPDENGSKEALNSYNGQNVTIKLPSNVSISQINYLAVWCVTYKHNFGHTYFHKKVPGQSLGKSVGSLKQLAHNVRSGPIVAVDKKTIFVPNLYYDGKGSQAQFWAGKGSEPSASGFILFDEKGSRNHLSNYEGRNIYLTLPHNTTTDNINYFAIWSVKEDHPYGYTLIPKNVEIPEINGNPFYTVIKKCCPIDQVLMPEGCSPSSQKFNLTVNIRDRIDFYALKNIFFEPFVQSISCEHKMYPLDPKEDNFLLLTNGSLTVLNTNEILPMDSYCFETVNFKEDEKDRWETTPFLCIPSASASMSKSTFVLYGTGVLLSAAFLIVTAFVYFCTENPRNARDKCIMFYSLSMAMVFVCLSAVQFSKLNDISCVVVAYVIQFFLVSSFTWFTMMSVETLFKVFYYDNDAYTLDSRRFTVYLSIGFFIPIFTFGLSFLVDQIPDIPTVVLKQQFGDNECRFDDNEPAYVYVPIALSILTTAILGILMKVRLVRLATKHGRNIAWITLQGELKLMQVVLNFKRF
ncbi:hypothetical protein FQR65_LT11116 [Abscondita terminalis]|nr:hypothetical protein FQR65_LT11116 [Abscondita terminalis]